MNTCANCNDCFGSNVTVSDRKCRPTFCSARCHDFFFDRYGVESVPTDLSTADAMVIEMNQAWDDRMIDECHAITYSPGDTKPDLVTALRWRVKRLMVANEAWEKAMDRRAVRIVELQEEIRDRGGEDD